MKTSKILEFKTKETNPAHHKTWNNKTQHLHPDHKILFKETPRNENIELT